MKQITIGGAVFQLIDVRSNITLADSFVMNKIGSGHGEAKLYVGNENTPLTAFFEGFSLPCFFVRADFERYLDQSEAEFLQPTQPYRQRSGMPSTFVELKQEVSLLPDGLLPFTAHRSEVAPPRVYLNSDSDLYKLMRRLGLPNYSYASIMKVQAANGQRYLYFRMFIDFSAEVDTYTSSHVEADVETSELRTRIAERPVRDFQEKYRRQLLDEFMSICPITRVNDDRLLQACHIVPVNRCSAADAQNPKNGIILTPTYHKLFDLGLLSFSDDGHVLLSPWLSPQNAKWLNLRDGMTTAAFPVDLERSRFLQEHRSTIFNA